MSLTIIKAGILDTIQDGGRYHFQHLGINPSGAMDRFSALLANCLLGKNINAPVIEMHFPAPVIRFEEAALICLAGADFYPSLNHVAIPNNQPIAVQKGAVLRFAKVVQGTRCYIAVQPDFLLTQWLGSDSTNLKAGAGGYQGRALQKGDSLVFQNSLSLSHFLGDRKWLALPFFANPHLEITTSPIDIIKGNEWNWLTEESKDIFMNQSFVISSLADRMGYRLQGKNLMVKEETQLVSSAVSFGTLQLLPNGQLIVLMADHQTTGGYPRIGHIISAHLPFLAQKKPNDTFTFKIVDVEAAEEKWMQQHRYLLSVQWASAYQIEKIIS